MNTTHPDAKPREQREHDELIWQWCRFGTRFAIVTANGALIAQGLTKENARNLCREHNTAVEVAS